MLDPRTVVLKEDLLAMKDTARSSGSLFIQEPSLGYLLCLKATKQASLTLKVAITKPSAHVDGVRSSPSWRR
jgi:hypothetical protein